MFENCKISSASRIGQSLVVLFLVVFFLGNDKIATAQNSTDQPATRAQIVVGSAAAGSATSPVLPTNPILTTGNIVGSSSSATSAMPRMRGTTNKQRMAAAAHGAIARANSKTVAARAQGLGAKGNVVVGIPSSGSGSGVKPDLGVFYFSGLYPNYANSPLPNPNDTSNCKAPNYCGIRKFVDQLSIPGGVPTKSLGQTMPIAVPDTTTFPGSDYYEIELRQYTEKLHSDLLPTMLRGYVQTNMNTGMTPHYLGPLIVAQTNRPVRVKFTNKLGSVADTNFATTGKLFVPEDNSVLGSGLGLAQSLTGSPYLDNRATIHMHGGNTPWISDGTPHQWTVPAGDASLTLYPRGDSVQFVPDMWFDANGAVLAQCGTPIPANLATCANPDNSNMAALKLAKYSNDSGPGTLTFYYTNQQSARLMFYHDHSYGTTRLNVYIGEAGSYLIQDQAELDLINGTNVSGIFGAPPPKSIPAIEVPLIIQDKTFVPPNFAAGTTVYSVPLLQSGANYTTAPIGFSGGCAIEPTATATIGLRVDPFGLYINGAVTGITLLTYGSGCTSDPIVSIGGDGTGAAAFASLATLSQQDPTWDTDKWGGVGNLWYPHVYMPNQWPNNPDGSGANPMGRWDYAAWFWPAFTNQYQVRDPIPCHNPLNLLVTGLDDLCPGTPTAMNPADATATSKLGAGAIHLGVGSVASLTPEAFMDTPMVNGTVYPTLTLDPQAYRFRVLSIGNDRTLNLSWFVACGTGGYTPSAAASAMPCPVPTVAGIAAGTEVGMVPASPTAGYPLWWPTDGRDGGVPDPASAGPDWYAIGNEGGVLPAPTVIPAAPVNYEYSRRSVTVTNTSTISLNLMPAERADVIVDFTAFAGKTLILYNDAPAPYPAFDTRYDYYTGDPDQTGAGGAPTTLAGFGPNTRTIMQVKVNSSVTGPATTFNPAALATYLPVVFKATQPAPIVPEPAYSAIYAPKGTQFKPIMPTLGSNSITYSPIGAAVGSTVKMTYGQKAIQELFELDYGRMNATLGTEIQLTTYNNQTTIPLGYPDPFTDDIYDSSNVSGQPVGVAGDGTQIWEVIHNGVDSHAIHFHLYNVQIIDRVGWDGTLRAPFPNELGWKDTVRMNPLEIDFVALRPMKQTLPFPVPDSTRLLDVTRPVGLDPALTPFTPTNAASTQKNSVVTMGWEYVWHCHILGHEENDMMREMTFQVPPETPVSVVATMAVAGTGATVMFTDKSASETGFEVQRADDALFAVNATPLPFPSVGAAADYNTSVSYTDKSAAPNQMYYYRVRSYKPDADYWTKSNPKLFSAWSAVAQTGAAPVLAVTPATLPPFGNQLLLTSSAPQTVTLSNSGAGSLSVGNITFAGANPTDFIQTNTCTAAIVSPATCTILVMFTPTAVGARAGNLTFTTTDPTKPLISIPLSGIGISPAMVLSPVAITFGNQQVGTVSLTPLVVTISNSTTGTAPLSLGSIILSGINAAEFSMTQTCGTTFPATLAVGASCSASFTFAPTLVGVQSVTLTVAAASPAVSQSVAISGTGTAPAATLAPTTLSFVNTLVNSPSAAQTVTLGNTGLASLSITSIAVAGINPGDFSQTNSCGTTLASGASCAILVTFKPLARGARTGTLVVTDNALAPSTQSVSLSGTGIAPVAMIIPASLTFGVQVIATTSAPQTLVLLNSGDLPLNIGTMSVNGANASEFASTRGNCGSVLPVFSSCALSVTFTPAVSGLRTGVLAIATSDPITPVFTVPLNGTGTAVSLSPAAISFGSLTVGTSSTSRTVTIANAGTSALTINNIVLSGTNLVDFTLNNQCGTTVASGRSCTVRVRFAPTTTGIRSASLDFSTSDLGTPLASVALSGTGTAPALSASPTTLTFSSPVNLASAVQPVTVSNVGTAPLTITSINLGGTNTGQFNQTNSCTIGQPMLVGASCVANVTFLATSANPLIKSQTLNINVAAPAISQSIPLTGTVIVPTYTVSPASIAFPNQAINTTSAIQTTTVTNTGTVPLPLTNVAIAGQRNRFAETNTCGASLFRPFPSSLPVGASCTISTTFQPTAASTSTSSLTISVGGGATPAQTQIQLTGTGQ